METNTGQLNKTDGHTQMFGIQKPNPPSIIIFINNQNNYDIKNVWSKTARKIKNK